nr:hypothetical protein [Tanacetum cinerariifolium]
MTSLKVQTVGNIIHKAFPLPGIEFPLAEEVPTASGEEKPLPKEKKSHCQEDCTAIKVKKKFGETGKKSRRTVTLTTEDMQKKKNDVKARTTLLLSLPDDLSNCRIQI